MFNWIAPNGETFQTSQLASGRAFIKQHNVCKMEITDMVVYYKINSDFFMVNVPKIEFEQAVNLIDLKKELNK